MRYEIKYEVESFDPEFVRNAIITHPISFKIAYPDRKVHNIYFDTSDLDFFYQNINGDPDRRKIRLRWYNDNLPSLEARLETKCKQRELGWKEVKTIDTDLRDKDISEITGIINEIVSPGQPLVAALVNDYDRSYYESFDGKFRMTMDRGLSFGDPALMDVDTARVVMNTTVLEVKFDQGEMDYFEDINRYLPFRQTKFSKYATGISMIRMYA